MDTKGITLPGRNTGQESKKEALPSDFDSQPVAKEKEKAGTISFEDI